MAPARQLEGLSSPFARHLPSGAPPGNLGVREGFIQKEMLMPIAGKKPAKEATAKTRAKGQRRKSA